MYVHARHIYWFDDTPTKIKMDIVMPVTIGAASKFGNAVALLVPIVVGTMVTWPEKFDPATYQVA